MLTFLFWNIQKRPIGNLIASIARQRLIDVILVAECDRPVRILEELNKSYTRQYNYHVNPVPRIEVFSLFPSASIESLGDYNGLNFRRLQPPIGKEILLVGAHLSSKLHLSDTDQMFECTRLASKIQEFEARLGHKRTVVVGDFNMNPFEYGLIAAHGFHAAVSRQIARRNEREIKGEQYSFFYNPMWNHFGDRGPSPPGTFFYDKSAPTNIYWNIFDQVILRPDLLGNFRDESVEIITSVEGVKLLRPNGRPNTTVASDHLPIVFALNLLEDSHGN